jgi:hypothetical protein
MRKILVGVVAACLLIPTVVLAGSEAPLTPGKPAGVRVAQEETTSLFVGLGVVALLAVGAVAASDCCKQDNNPVQFAPTTTFTATSTV